MRAGTVSYKLEDLKKGVIIPIGFVGENDFTKVFFDAEEIYKKYPNASVSMKVQPPKGGIYPATVSRDGNTVIWQVKEADVANRGGGELQLTFTDGETKIKTYIAKTDVKRSLAGNGPAPDPVQDWIDDAEEVLDDLEAMDTIAKNAQAGDIGKALSPKTVEDGVVTEWQYIETGGGTEDYSDLENKPSIGGVTLAGDKSLHDLGIAAESAIPDVSGKANLSVVAPAFDQATANDAGSLVTYTDGVVYVLPEGHTVGTTWANTQKTATNIAEQQRLLKNSIDGVKSNLSEITEGSSSASPNILNPALLNVGTVKTVAITKNDDVIKYNGTATGTDGIKSQPIDTLEVGKTYTAIIFSESNKNVNAVISFFDDESSTSSTHIISTVIMRDGSTKSLNTAYTFTVPEGTLATRFSLGTLYTVVYNNEEYRIEIVEGSTAPESYQKYGNVSTLTAKDTIARAGLVKSCYVSPLGSDSNDGTASHPFATFQHAIDEGYKKIFASDGLYSNQQIVMDNLDGISIICNSSGTEANIFESHARRKRAKIDNSIDIGPLTADGSIYKAPLTESNDSSYYKVFISQTLDPDYSDSEYYGRITTYNAILWEITDSILTCTRLVPKLTKVECEATQGSFFFDGNYIYINPTDGDVTGKTYKRLNLDTNQYGVDIRNCTNILIQGIDIAFFPYTDLYFGHCEDITIKDCCFTFTCYGSAVKVAGADAVFYSCVSAQAGTDGFGITSYGDVSFYNCSGIRCYDDGISHHDGATGIIDGGLWMNCLKGGVTPSYGSNVNVKNVVCKGNVYGIYYPQGEGRTTDAIQYMQNCLSVENTNKDIKVTGYNVVSHGCVYGTKSVDTGATLTEYGNTIVT